MSYKEIEHPTHLLYQDLSTGEYVTPVPGPNGVMLKRVRFVPRREEPLLLSAPQTEPVLRIPRYSESHQEEERQSSPPIVHKRSWLSNLPLEFRIAAAVITILFVCSSMIVVSHPKALQTIIPALAPQAPVATSKPTEQLHRISQMDTGQYDAGQSNYAPSACSAASLTEIFNSFGGSYRISVVLGYEVSIGAITVSDGLVDISGIAKTAQRFGFDAKPIGSLDQAISTANDGTPVMVNLLPSSYWTTGHFLVLLGADDSNVRLADSSNANYQTITKERFDAWRSGGQMWAISPSKYSLLQGHPTMSADQVNAFLDSKHSPMTGQGQLFVDLSNQYHVDDAYVVATFDHESQGGLKGEARLSKSPGNLRCPTPDWTGGWCQDGYEWFHDWQSGLKALYILLDGSRYSGAGNNTPASIIPLFAPSADNNNEAAYIAAIEKSEDLLR